MPPPDAQTLLQHLYDDNWLVRSHAAHKLRQFPELTLPVIARFFDLTFDDKAPVRAVCEAAIGFMKSSAVPYLLDQSQSRDASRRQQAIELLWRAGGWSGATCHLSTQVLGPRVESLPDWADRAEEVFAAFSRTMSDPNLSVRFAAASALDDFNRSTEETIPVFMEALSKGTVHEKNWAALRLGRIGPMARAAREALAKLAAASFDQADVWSKHASRAAQVALERIGCTDSMNKEPRHPLRFVVWTWLLLSVLFAATAPFVEVPWPEYVFGGSAYALFLGIVSAGLALLGPRRTTRILFVGGGVAGLGCLSLTAILILRVLPDAFVPMLRVGLYATGIVIIGAAAFAIWGWVVFLRGSHNPWRM